MELKVSHDIKESGVYESIADALRYAHEGDVIHIFPGIYKERLAVLTRGITLLGDDPEKTVITYDLRAKEPFGEKIPDKKYSGIRGTFRSYTLLAYADGITLKNLTIENSAGSGDDIGQAIALYAEGNDISVINCRLLGHQDTLFTGPLPPEEIQSGGFTGPTEFAPRIQGKQSYVNCYIEGDVDFIFGSAEAYFKECEICSLHRDKDPEGYVTAPSTPEKSENGYIFINCSFTSKGCHNESVYLSRPWREYAKAVFINCSYGPHIKSEGFHDWNKEKAHETSFYAEYPMQPKRVSWAHTLDDISLYENK